MAELITMNTDQKATGTIPQFPDPRGFVDSSGAPAKVGSVPVWELVTPDVGTFSVDADGMTNVSMSAPDMAVDSPPLTNQLKMTVDVDRTDGGTENLEILFDFVFNSLNGPNAAGLGAPLFTIGPK